MTQKVENSSLFDFNVDDYGSLSHTEMFGHLRRVLIDFFFYFELRVVTAKVRNNYTSSQVKSRKR